MVTLKLCVHLVIRSIINTFNRTNLEEHYQGRGKEARRMNLLCLLLLRLNWTPVTLTIRFTCWSLTSQCDYSRRSGLYKGN